MSIREYPEHYYYIDMYSNSADSMCILNPDASVVDCNGATLRMLQCRTRSDLIGTCLLDRLADYDGVLGADTCLDARNIIGSALPIVEVCVERKAWCIQVWTFPTYLSSNFCAE